MKATYFDGRSAKAHAVEISLEGDMVVIMGGGIDRRDPLASVVIADALGSAPRILKFVGGASCEVENNRELETLVSGQLAGRSQVSRWEGSWKLALGALALVSLTALAAYRYGLPLMARSAAERMPASALNSLSSRVEAVLDRTVFSPSEIPDTRVASLLETFNRLDLPPRNALALRFRHAKSIGANAMALPSGTVYVTDQLIELTPDDRVLIAVIAHEAGHVDKRHGLRQVIQSSVVGILVTWYLGDVSALGAAAPAALVNAKYSRDLEREADAYAANVLRTNHMPVSLLADALELIEKSHDREGRLSLGTSYLSTHPATAERLAWIRAQ